MKRIFLTKRNAIFSPAGFSWGITALALIVTLLLMRLFLPELFLRLAAPFIGVGDSITNEFSNLSAGFDSNAALARANENLLAENIALSLENTALAARAADLEKLQGSVPPAVASVVAGVIARPPESSYDTFVIAAGANDGVKPGDSVYGPGGVPIGKVSNISASSAHVALFSSAGTETDGWVGAARIPLAIFGNGGGTFSASVSRAAGIVVGDAVYAPGPGALPVGSVVRIDGDPASPMLSLRITPAINIFSITWVRVVAL